MYSLENPEVVYSEIGSCALATIVEVRLRTRKCNNHTARQLLLDPLEVGMRKVPPAQVMLDLGAPPFAIRTEGE